MTESEKDPYLVNALRKGIDVVDCFSRQETWTLAELAAALSQNKPTLFRILHTLEDAGYLVRDTDTGRYRLGMRFLALGHAALRHEQLRWQALPPLIDLASRTGETVYVGILYEGSAVCVQLVDGTHVVRMHSFVGKRSPAHASALGKVLLAHLPDAEVEAFVAAYGLERFTANTIADSARLREALRDIRQQGYAVDDEELESGLRCLGAPITDHSGRPFATVAVSGPALRMSLERIAALVPDVRTTALTISRMLGSPTLAPGRVAAAA